MSWARSSVALLNFRVLGRAGLAAVLGIGVDGTRALLEATLARSRAGSPGRPGAEGTVDRAVVDVALASEVVNATGFAAEERGADGVAVLSLEAGATALAAGGPAAVNALLAVRGARMGVTFDGVDKGRAYDTAVCGRNENLASLHLGARATGGGALGHRAPAGDCAVNGAYSVVAGAGQDETATGLAAEGRSTRGRADAALGAVAAGFGARGPLAVGRQDAVNRARLGVAFAGLVGGRRAKDTAVDAVGDDDERLSLVTGTAGLSALAPRSFVCELAVDRARFGVAVGRLTGSRASLAAELGSHEDGAVASHAASGAALGAFGPLGPAVLDAVDRALERVARSDLGAGTAGLAAVLGGNEGLADTLLGAGGTGLGASAPRGLVEGLLVAINRAESGGALLGFGERRAGVATSLGDGGDLAGALGGASAAGLGALGPHCPGADFAMAGARAEVALGVLALGTEAGLASVCSVGDDLADTEGSAGAAGARALLTTLVAEGSPCAQSAVDRAGQEVAGSRRSKSRATTATGDGIGGDLPGLGGEAAGAGLGALAGEAPGGDLAVLRAIVGATLAAVAGLAAVGAAVHTGDERTVAVRHTVAAGLGALAPTSPGLHDAVFRALDVVAADGLGEGTASFATRLVGGSDTATAGLHGARAARFSALAVEAPLRHDAVGRAALRVTGLGFNEDRAVLAAEGGVDLNGVVAGLLASTTGLGAGGEFGPGRHLAINRADVGVASLSLHDNTAGLAAVDGSRDRLADAGADATVAGLGAFAPGGPLGHLAILRAGTAALFADFERRAGVATDSGMSNNSPSAGTGAFAGLGAGSPGFPRGGRAVDRAVADVAVLLGTGSWAALAAVGSLVVDSTLTSVFASLAASSRALGPGLPFADNTVDRACGRVALLGVDHGAARLATPGVGARHGAGLQLEASVARLGASRVLRPGRGDAVNRAVVLVADSRLETVGFAGKAIPGSSNENWAGAGGDTRATSAGALAERGPGAELASNRAVVLVAASNFAHVSARAAAEEGRNLGSALAGLCAATAGLGARRPNTETSNSAITRALGHLADSGFNIVLASLATEVGRAIDGTSLGGGTGTAGLGASRGAAPLAHDAIDRAFVDVALLGLREDWALDTSGRGHLADLAGACRVANTA